MMGTMLLIMFGVMFLGGALTGGVLGFWLLCWVLKTRAKQNGMQADLERLLAKPNNTPWPIVGNATCPCEFCRVARRTS